MKQYLGKKVFLETISQRRYSGEVVFANELFLELIDKFGGKVTIAVSNIAEIKEER